MAGERTSLLMVVLHLLRAMRAGSALVQAVVLVLVRQASRAPAAQDRPRCYRNQFLGKRERRHNVEHLQ